MVNIYNIQNLAEALKKDRTGEIYQDIVNQFKSYDKEIASLNKDIDTLKMLKKKKTTLNNYFLIYCKLKALTEYESFRSYEYSLGSYRDIERRRINLLYSLQHLHLDDDNGIINEMIDGTMKEIKAINKDYLDYEIEQIRKERKAYEDTIAKAELAKEHIAKYNKWKQTNKFAKFIFKVFY